MNIDWKRDFEPHVTHKMSKWRSAIRMPANTSRFYSVRECQNCELEQGKSVAGEYYEIGLETICLWEEDE